MATLDVKVVTPDELPAVVVLREADEAECHAAGLSPLEALTCSVRLSAQAWEARVDGRVVGWFGHTPVSILGNMGVVWCLSAPAADDHRTLFGRRSYSYLQYMLSLYAEVICQVDLNHKQAKRWLKWLGFSEINRCGKFATMKRVR